MEEVTKSLKAHYEVTFERYGACSKGVDWGDEERLLALRYEEMLAVIPDPTAHVTLLDVGCGFGGLLRYSRAKGLNFSYTGIDVAQNMVQWARKEFPESRFLLGDVLETSFDRKFDFVVCNGILTQKLETAGLAMDQYAHRLIKHMYDLCLEGVAFNVMTTKVNYFANNLYYRNPAELLSWCMSEVTRYVRIDHAYPLFEYTIYLYRQPQSGSLD